MTLDASKSFELLSLRELADLLKVSPGNARLLAAKGSLPRPVRVGRLLRWRRDAIEQWLSQQGESA